jgi:hypothetical protein
MTSNATRIYVATVMAVYSSVVIVSVSESLLAYSQQCDIVTDSGSRSKSPI